LKEWFVVDDAVVAKAKIVQGERNAKQIAKFSYLDGSLRSKSEKIRFKIYKIGMKSY
jgi:hypothetical protein